MSLRVAIVGASGYTGAELVRLCLGHPELRLGPLVGNSKAGQPVEDVLPSLAGRGLGTVQAFDADAVADAADVAFCGLPHGASAGIVSELRDRGLPVLDLSADFRLDDPAVYAEWYGEHLAPQRFAEGVYGLTELHRDELPGAELIAVPGCNATASILALGPLVKERLAALGGLVCDIKTGVSGAGRVPKPSTHFPETGEGVRAYKAAGLHRHTPEIEQELGRLAGEALRVSFNPHLVPMNRGILATCYAMGETGADAVKATEAARALYAGSPSVVVREAGVHPDTLWVRGSNQAQLSYHHDARTGRLVAFAAIDNLMKGAAGAAVQALNVRQGFEESAGLAFPATWP
ncbi:MAG: N-acetyl-gamma-glutamyl-phosphate reductase [Myxococcota bacterium]